MSTNLPELNNVSSSGNNTSILTGLNPDYLDYKSRYIDILGSNNAYRTAEEAKNGFATDVNNSLFAISSLSWSIVRKLLSSCNSDLDLPKSLGSFDSKASKLIYDSIVNGNTEISEAFYDGFLLLDYDLTGVGGKEKLSDEMVRSMFNISPDYKSIRPPSEILESLNSSLADLGVTIEESLIDNDSSYEPENYNYSDEEKKISKSFSKLNPLEHINAINRYPDLIDEEFAILTAVLVSSKSSYWSKISDEAKYKVLEYLPISNAMKVSYINESGHSSNIFTSWFIWNREVADFIAGEKELLDRFMDPSTDELYSKNLIDFSNHAKSISKRLKVDSLIKSEKYDTIWSMIMIDSNHRDFRNSGKSMTSEIGPEFVDFDFLSDEQKLSLLTNSKFLRAGYNKKVEVSRGSALLVLIRNNPDFFNRDEVFNFMFTDEDFLYCLVKASKLAVSKIESEKKYLDMVVRNECPHTVYHLFENSTKLKSYALSSVDHLKTLFNYGNGSAISGITEFLSDDESSNELVAKVLQNLSVFAFIVESIDADIFLTRLGKHPESVKYFDQSPELRKYCLENLSFVDQSSLISSLHRNNGYVFPELIPGANEGKNDYIQASIYNHDIRFYKLFELTGFEYHSLDEKYRPYLDIKDIKGVDPVISLAEFNNELLHFFRNPDLAKDFILNGSEDQVLIVISLLGNHPLLEPIYQSEEFYERLIYGGGYRLQDKVTSLGWFKRLPDSEQRAELIKERNKGKEESFNYQYQYLRVSYSVDKILSLPSN